MLGVLLRKLAIGQGDAHALSSRLPSWHLPESRYTTLEKVTLRRMYGLDRIAYPGCSAP
jgi:hypothetical protein